MCVASTATSTYRLPVLVKGDTEHIGAGVTEQEKGGGKVKREQGGVRERMAGARDRGVERTGKSGSRSVRPK